MVSRLDRESFDRAALSVYLIFFYLWLWRGAETGNQTAVTTPGPEMSVPVNAACAALSMAAAATAIFVFLRPKRRRLGRRRSSLLLYSHRRGNRDDVYADPQQPTTKKRF